MAWTFIGVSSVVEVTTTAHALVTTGISGLQSGDLLVACISSRIASTTSVTLPAGWTLVAEQKTNNTATNNSATPSALMAYIVRGASNPALTFTHPVAPSVAIGRILAYRGLGASLPALGAQTSFTTGTNTTAVSGAGLTTVQNGALIVAMTAGGQEAAWSAFDAATAPGTPSGATDTATPPSIDTWIERADTVTTTGSDTSLGIFDAVKSVAGATGNLTVTASVAAAHVVIAGSFKPPLVAVMAVNPGVIALDGSDGRLARSRDFNVDRGIVALNGNPAGMRKGFLATTVSSSVTLAGQPLSLRAARKLTATVYPAALSGIAASLEAGRAMPAASGAIVLTGIDAALTRTTAAVGYVLSAAPGAVMLTGIDADLVYQQAVVGDFTLNAAPGAIVLSGHDVLLSVSVPAYVPYYPVSMASIMSVRKPAGTILQRF